MLKRAMIIFLLPLLFIFSQQGAITHEISHYGESAPLTQSKDSFYGQHEPERMGVAKELLERWRAWEIGGALCSEMEAYKG